MTKSTLKRGVSVAISTVLALMLALTLAGCGSSKQTTTTATTVEQGDPVAIEGMDFTYTDRDCDPSYNDSEATHITLSGSSATVDGNGANVSGSTVTITAAGVYVVSGSLSDGQVVVEATSEDKVQIVLAGVTITNADGPAIYVKQADKVFLTLAEGTENTLSDGSSYVLDADDEPYATIFSKDDLTIQGSGSLNVTGNYRHAIACKDELVITGGIFTITSKEDAVRGKDCVKIKDGTFTITAGQDAIKSSCSDDVTKGFVLISGGTFAITASDDAIHGETVLQVCGGTIDVKSCYEGLEAEQIYVNGGSTHIVASDDGINAASIQAETGSVNEMTLNGGSPDGMAAEGGAGVSDANCLLQFNGGYTVVDATGDGLDSNGSIEFNGGVVLVCGPTSSGDGALDYDLSATVNGGTILIVGSTGMAQNFTSGSQAFFFTQVSGKAGSNVAVTDASGNVIMSFTASKSFSVVEGSAEGLSNGTSYKVVVGGTPSAANADGFATSGTVSGGSSTSVTASTTASGGLGGLGTNGSPMNAGQSGAAQTDPRSGQGAPNSSSNANGGAGGGNAAKR